MSRPMTATSGSRCLTCSARSPSSEPTSIRCRYANSRQIPDVERRPLFQDVILVPLRTYGDRRLGVIRDLVFAPAAPIGDNSVQQAALRQQECRNGVVGFRNPRLDKFSDGEKSHSLIFAWECGLNRPASRTYLGRGGAPIGGRGVDAPIVLARTHNFSARMSSTNSTDIISNCSSGEI